MEEAMGRLEGALQDGAGVVCVVGALSSGKTTSVLRFVHRQRELADEQRRPRAGAAQQRVEVLYATMRGAADVAALETRIQRYEEGRGGEMVVHDCIEATCREQLVLHIVVDDVGTTLCDSTAAEVGEAASRWFEGAGRPNNLYIWLLSVTAPAELPRYGRVVELPSPAAGAVAQQLAGQAAATGKRPRDVVQGLAEYYAARRPSQNSIVAMDSRRLQAQCAVIAEAMPAADARAYAAKPGKHAVQLAEAWSEAAKGAGASAAPVVVLTLSARLLYVACFFCGAQPAGSDSALLGDASARRNRRRKQQSTAPVAVNSSAHLYPLDRLRRVYALLARVAAQAHEGAGGGDGDGDDDPALLPTAEVALQHLRAFEGWGVVQRAAHNRSMLGCSISLEAAAQVAAQMHVDLYQLMPTYS
jgi:hypothetical protein